MTTEFTIDPEFASRFWDTTDQEDADLEAQILQDGKVIDALIIAEFLEDDEVRHILADGHRRYRVCAKLGMPYPSEIKKFASREDALYWMDGFQDSRRNLNQNQLSVVRDRHRSWLMSKDPKRGVMDVRDEVASEHGVSPRTVTRDQQFAEKVEQLDPAVKDMALRDLSRAHISELASLSTDQQREVLEQFEGGEFSSFRAALRGEESPPDEEAKPKKRKKKKSPEVEGGAHAAQAALGRLEDAISDIHNLFPDETNKKICDLYTKRLAGVLNAWGVISDE